VNKKRPNKHAAYDNGICEKCGGEFLAVPNFDTGKECELIWILHENKMILVCDGCKSELKKAK
tara:strand:+ start:13649 stop:13837 length:189 start_codon:yes stop_codon:yes gene_type:complete